MPGPVGPPAAACSSADTGESLAPRIRLTRGAPGHFARNPGLRVCITSSLAAYHLADNARRKWPLEPAWRCPLLIVFFCVCAGPAGDTNASPELSCSRIGAALDADPTGQPGCTALPIGAAAAVKDNGGHGAQPIQASSQPDQVSPSAGPSAQCWLLVPSRSMPEFKVASGSARFAKLPVSAEQGPASRQPAHLAAEYQLNSADPWCGRHARSAAR